MSPLPSLRARLAEATGGLPRPFYVLCAGTLVSRIGTFVVPFLALYLTQVRGLSVVQAGSVAALYGAGGAFAGPLGGFLADHIGRRALMVASLALGGLGMILLGQFRSLEVIAPAVFVLALVTEMYRPGMQAAVADLVPPSDRVRAYGLLYWVINLGFSIGLTIGGLLATVSFTLLFVCDGLTTLAFALLVWRGVPETRPAPAAGAERGLAAAAAGFLAPYRDGTFLRFLGLGALIIIIFMQHISTFPIDMAAHGVSRAAFGSVLALNGIVIVLVQPFLSPVLARHNRSRVLAAGSALVAAGFGLNAVADAAPWYALGVVIWTLGEVGVLPVANTVVADLAPTHLRGRYQGAFGMSWGVASFVAPLLGSYVLQEFGSLPLWLGTLALGLLVAAGHLALAPRLARERERRLAAR
jgi:MFS family permease